MAIKLLFVLVLLIFEGDSSKSYAKYRTYQVTPKTKGQMSALLELEGVDGIDFWTMPTKTKPAIVMVAPRVRQNFLQVLTQIQVPHEIVISDLEEAVHSERMMQKRQKLMNRRSLSNDDHLSRFLRYHEIINFLRNEMEESDGLAKLEVIGDSFEGRPTYMIRLSTNFEANKPIIMLEAGMHAREWAGPAFTLHVIHQLIRNPALLEYNDYHIIPVANPDGYEYTHTTERFWRKTRSKRPGRDCVGADGNRNFDTHWAVVGSSNRTCSEIYHGDGPFSEIESKNVALVGHKYGTRIVVYVAVHSFGNYLLYPMGHTKHLLPDAEDMELCARAFAFEILKNHGPKFTVGNTAIVLYPSGGGSDDYMKEKVKIPFAYTLELPGGGRNGFDLPPQEISKMANEIFPGILTLVNCWRNKDSGKITFPEEAS